MTTKLVSKIVTLLFLVNVGILRELEYENQRNLLPIDETTLSNNDIASIVRHKWWLNKASISDFSAQFPKHLQSFLEYLVVANGFRIHVGVIGSQATAVVACLKQFGRIGIIPILIDC